ncbi:hypothetical protein Agub_g10899 [Astrephomene gubernaculifera]|uniref:allantoinase n=1 Tax=Astrephomene gubernaculifera TaxID=47775 RepID=A0AAD3DXX7_9CHLO|nr:hypothetical protein Agub_g10899 [Astrephomene gubernaculifera]
MVDRTALGMMVLLNAIAAGVLYQRFHDHPQVQMLESRVLELYHKVLPPKSPDRCGALKWPSYVLISERVVFPDGVRPGAVYIEGSRIVAVSENVSVDLPHVMNFRDAVISPGVIDVHCHLNEPGREEWEGIFNGTRAAASGGVTTLVDMPLNSAPATTTPQQLEAKKTRATAKSFTHLGFWAGLVPANAANHSQLAALQAGGAAGFKAFMCPSGIRDFPHVGEAELAAALPYIKRAGVPLFVHAELVEEGGEEQQQKSDPAADPTLYDTYLATRPPSFERSAVQLLVRLLDSDATPAAPGFRLHIAHLGDAGALEDIQAARQRHPITVETCAHYLTFASEDVPRGATHFKCAPPLRGAANRAALRRAVAEGRIDLVSSDHSPAPPDMKATESGDFLTAWGGISGGQYLLPATWSALREGSPPTAAASESQLLRLTQLLSEAPAALAGLAGRKGRLEAGFDADIVVWEPEVRTNTSVALNLHTHKLSPYTDAVLYGKVIATVVGGELTALYGHTNPRPCGKLVLRGT